VICQIYSLFRILRGFDDIAIDRAISAQPKQTAPPAGWQPAIQQG
jgi:hypothetical protein